MGQAYTPGLKVTDHITHRVRRVLPIEGDVLVNVGDTVGPNDVVAETFMPGDITPLNMSNLLAMPPGDVHECMIKKEGERIKAGEVLAQTKGIFGMFRKEYTAKVEGTIETISDVTGQVIIRGEAIPVQVRAYMAGTVVEVLPKEGCIIENDVAFIQGIFGICGETHGRIVMACKSHKQELSVDVITPDMKDAIVIGGERATHAALERAREVGARAVVSGGIDDQDLRDFLGHDLGVAITGSEDVGLTMIITEGFGEIAMARKTFELLQKHEGEEASVNGATQIRAGVMRPEIIIPLSPDAVASTPTKDDKTGLLEPGRNIRIIRDPYFGLIGEVAGLPPEPQVLGSGSKARVLEVRLDSGESVTVPRANVELIEE